MRDKIKLIHKGDLQMKKAFFYIDDVIWVLRDLTRNRPASIFDHPFLNMLKTAYEKYGVKTKLNLFYRTDYFYGYDEFSLEDMTDAYRTEWEANSHFLKLSFHAKHEFPDYPHVNAKYEDIKSLFKDTEREVIRFAGKNSFSYSITPHWLPMSKAGVQALYDCGAKILDCTVGDDVREYNGDSSSLPYGHEFRLLHNRQPETKVFTRPDRDPAIANSICAYNHLTTDIPAALANNLEYHIDKETGMAFKKFGPFCLNVTPFEEIEPRLTTYLGNEYVGVMDHEQYFYEDYFNYQPDYADKIFKMGEMLKEKGYEFFFIEEIVK